MALSHSPSIITNGLVLCLDAANLKGYDKFENLLTNSNISSVNWNPNSSPVLTNNASTSPDGTINATQIAASAAAGSGIFRTISLTSGTVYTYSVFVKAVSGSNTIYFGTDIGTDTRITVNTSTGVASLNFGSPTNITSTSYPNGWYRVSFTFTASATATHSFVIYNLTANANTWLAWGAQVEIGSSVTDYYATTSTAKNRGTIWSDLSGNGNTGTLTNGVGYGNSNSGSFVFDGTNDFVSISASSSLGKSLNYTTSAWVRYSDVGYTSWMMVCDSVVYSIGGGYMMWISSDSPATGKLLASFDGSWQYGTVRIPPNTWTHITISKNNNQLSFYINGLFDVTRTYNFNSSTSSTAVDIGYSSRNAGYPVNGNISQVSIYNRALTAAEVQQNFNALRGRFGI